RYEGADALLRRLGAIFCHVAPFFRLYAMYAEGIKAAQQCFADAVAKNERFRRFLFLQESVTNTKLSELLRAPLKRLEQLAEMFGATFALCDGDVPGM
ncbi:MAG: hypothetical protein MHM6MM_009637, partial [Cercozoa sp. M6MM]